MKKSILIAVILILLSCTALAGTLENWVGKKVEVHMSLSTQKSISGKLTACDEHGVTIDDKYFINYHAIDYVELD